MLSDFNLIKQRALERFIRYVKIDTQADESSDTYPSTRKQFDLANLLVEELLELGVRSARVDENCVVMATLDETVCTPQPVIGFLAHLDTATEVSGAQVKPHIIENYRGGDIVVNKEKGVVISEAENKELAECIGHTLVTADGTTLLGSDDKAGIAAIMTVIEYLAGHPEIPHGKVAIAFTPDEEIGRGVEFFDIQEFGAGFAYTVDGGFTGELNNETFSADAAVIEMRGRDMHPGTAKDRMVNTLRAMAEVIVRLPKNMAPETTQGHEPYIHPQTLEGKVCLSRLKLLLRDFTDKGLEFQRKKLERIVDEAGRLFPGVRSTLAVTPTYRNMLPELRKHPEVTSRLEVAVRKAGIVPDWQPIRGGTDGSVLTACGLPTPNIFTGGCNSHSLTEWQSIDALAKIVEVIVNIVQADEALSRQAV
jgi:tripeptide aminopeptidase